ncbi:hypothetical protein BC567DRAFT_22852 [Phyllosticta citribraziliensis]
MAAMTGRNILASILMLMLLLQDPGVKVSPVQMLASRKGDGLESCRRRQRSCTLEQNAYRRRVPSRQYVRTAAADAEIDVMRHTDNIRPAETNTSRSEQETRKGNRQEKGTDQPVSISNNPRQALDYKADRPCPSPVAHHGKQKLLPNTSGSLSVMALLLLLPARSGFGFLL